MSCDRSLSVYPGIPLVSVSTIAGLCLLMFTVAAHGQLGPVRSHGYFEYQYRLTDAESAGTTNAHLGTFKIDADTYVWEPYILQVDGFMALTRSLSASNQNGQTIDQTSNLVTGGLSANLFPQSHFPLRTYFERRDSRTDDEVINLGVTTNTFGFLQQYAPRGGGRYSLDYRKSSDDRSQDDDFPISREFQDERLQLSLAKGKGRNDLRLNSLVGETQRLDQNEIRRRITHNLRHRFRNSARFYVENSAFYSSEDFDLGGIDSSRRFVQVNGNATWRPDTEKPLLVTTRALIQGTDSGSADMSQSATNSILTSIATYQLTDRTTISANVGFGYSDIEDGKTGSTAFQLIRTSYRSSDYDFLNGRYQWTGTIEGSNRDEPENGDTSVDTQGLVGKFDHNLSKNFALSNGRRMQLSLSQRMTGSNDRLQGSWQMLDHSLYLTLNRQVAQTSSYVRLSITDRRQFGFNEGEFQLANIQASRVTQANRYRSWSGSLTFQYNRNTRKNESFQESRRDALNYSADVRYRHLNLFDVQNLIFTSELRLLSNNFMTDDPLDRSFDMESERRDTMWRNRLIYRIGLLEFDLRTDLREIQNEMTSLVFLRVRRYYGTT